MVARKLSFMAYYSVLGRKGLKKSQQANQMKNFMEQQIWLAHCMVGFILVLNSKGSCLKEHPVI